jgi:hypothetical protein
MHNRRLSLWRLMNCSLNASSGISIYSLLPYVSIGSEGFCPFGVGGRCSSGTGRKFAACITSCFSLTFFSFLYNFYTFRAGSYRMHSSTRRITAQTEYCSHSSPRRWKIWIVWLSQDPTPQGYWPGGIALTRTWAYLEGNIVCSIHLLAECKWSGYGVTKRLQLTRSILNWFTRKGFLTKILDTLFTLADRYVTTTTTLLSYEHTD